MSRIVVVSNRVANLKAKTQSGGLAVALADAMRERGGLWFGWNGETVENDDADLPCETEEIGKVTVVSMPLPAKEHEGYYAGYSNSMLWPLFHYRLDLIEYAPEFSEAYSAVNERFARALLPHLEEDDLIWIQDYHLIPLGSILRRLGCHQRIGFFLHIPFPPPDLFTAAPENRKLISGFLAYDVIGLQTKADVHNLLRSFDYALDIRTSKDGNITAPDNRTVRVGAFPVAIDTDEYRKMAEDMPDDVRFDLARNRMLKRKQAIGVERLDYSKGLPERIEAVDRMLAAHPELESRFSLLQISPPTRENVSAYADIRAELEQMTGAVNGKYSHFNWTPVRYIHRSVPRDKLAGLLRASDVGLVTPLRDGMNLVAKEFVAAQNPEDPGVLVLSQFAGAAEEMTDAVIVNPFDADDMAEKLYLALTMPLDERKARHKALYDYLTEHDTTAWVDSFLKVLEDKEPNGSGSITAAA